MSNTILCDDTRPACVGPGNEIGLGFYRWWQSVEAEDWGHLEGIGLSYEALARWIADDEYKAAELLADGHMQWRPSLLITDELAFVRPLQDELLAHYQPDIDRACKTLHEHALHVAGKCRRDCPYCLDDEIRRAG